MSKKGRVKLKGIEKEEKNAKKDRNEDKLTRERNYTAVVLYLHLQWLQKHEHLSNKLSALQKKPKEKPPPFFFK